MWVEVLVIDLEGLLVEEQIGARRKMTSPGGAALQVPLEREHFGRKPDKWFGAAVWRECG